MTQQALPDAEQLVQQLIEQLRPHVTPQSAIVGIHTGGAWLAAKLHAALGTEMPFGTLDISFYRDDFNTIGLHPEVKPTAVSFDVEGRDIILVDDVLQTGRTIRAAMNELFDYGRPASIRLVVLVDRSGRELPICAEFYGSKLDLAPGQSVKVTQDECGRLGLSLLTREDSENRK